MKIRGEGSRESLSKDVPPDSSPVEALAYPQAPADDQNKRQATSHDGT